MLGTTMFTLGYSLQFALIKSNTNWWFVILLQIPEVSFIVSITSTRYQWTHERNSTIPEKTWRTARHGDSRGYRSFTCQSAPPFVWACRQKRDCGVPLGQVRQEQESRGNNLPVGRIHSSRSARQKIEGTNKFIVVRCEFWAVMQAGVGAPMIPVYAWLSQQVYLQGKLVELQGLMPFKNKHLKKTARRIQHRIEKMLGWAAGSQANVGAGKPYLKERKGVLALHFDASSVQSEMSIDLPDELVFSYTKAMMSFLLFEPSPKRIAMIGLGGGSLAKYCYPYLPHAANNLF